MVCTLGWKVCLQLISFHANRHKWSADSAGCLTAGRTLDTAQENYGMRWQWRVLGWGWKWKGLCYTLVELRQEFVINPPVWAARVVEHFWAEGSKQLQSTRVMYPAQERLLCSAEGVNLGACQINFRIFQLRELQKRWRNVVQGMDANPSWKSGCHYSATVYRDLKSFLALIWNVYLG